MLPPHLAVSLQQPLASPSVSAVRVFAPCPSSLWLNSRPAGATGHRRGISDGPSLPELGQESHFRTHYPLPPACLMGPYLGTQLLAILGQLAQLLMTLLKMCSLGLHQTQHLVSRWAGNKAGEDPQYFPFPSCSPSVGSPHPAYTATATHKFHDIKLPLVLNHVDLRAQKYLWSVLNTQCPLPRYTRDSLALR